MFCIMYRCFPTIRVFRSWYKEMAMLASKDFYSSKKVTSSGAGSLHQEFITALTWYVLVKSVFIFTFHAPLHLLVSGDSTKISRVWLNELTLFLFCCCEILWCQYCHFWQLRINCENLYLQQWWSENPKLPTITINAISTDCSGQQESIPVECVPPACWSCRCTWGVSRGGVSEVVTTPTPPDPEADPPCLLTNTCENITFAKFRLRAVMMRGDHKTQNIMVSLGMVSENRKIAMNVIN